MGRVVQPGGRAQNLTRYVHFALDYCDLLCCIIRWLRLYVVSFHTGTEIILYLIIVTYRISYIAIDL
jgi:hypothetical protein